ncbi:MAG: HAD family hydrolase [Nanobdellota archaeon]
MRYMIFDLDGVLMDSMPNHIKSWKETLRSIGINPSERELAVKEGETSGQYIDYFTKKEGISLSEEKREELNNMKKRLFRQLDSKPYQIIEHLKELKRQGMKMAVATGSRREVASAEIKENFDDLFECIISGDDVEEGKPAPDTYLKALQSLGGNKGEAIIIENAPTGITAGKRAGMTVFALKTTLPEEELLESDRIFDDHEELFSFITDTYINK